MKTKIINEGQNIFDAMLETTGSVSGAIGQLIEHNDSVDWDVQAGDELNFPNVDPIDHVVLASYNKRSFVPTNGEIQGVTFSNDFNDDFAAGMLGALPIGTGQIGFTFIVN